MQIIIKQSSDTFWIVSDFFLFPGDEGEIEPDSEISAALVFARILSFIFHLTWHHWKDLKVVFFFLFSGPDWALRLATFSISRCECDGRARIHPARVHTDVQRAIKCWLFAVYFRLLGNSAFSQHARAYFLLLPKLSKEALTSPVAVLQAKKTDEPAEE